MENNFNDEERVYPQKSKKKKIIATISAVVAASTLAAALVIPAGAQEATTATLTYKTEETADQGGSIVLTDVSDIVKEVLPSVVSITSRTIYNYYNSSDNSYGMNDIWGYFFGDSNGNGGNNYYGGGYPSYDSGSDSNADSEDTENSDDQQYEEIDAGIGSGTIIAQTDEELLILTSYHVVEDCSSLYVTFCNDTNIDGYIKSADADKDIAVVAVAMEDIDQDTLDSISVAPIAQEEPEVGDGVIVIGNALGYGISVTTGIVSAENREITVDGLTLNVIQTDAAINSGNSGGCMLNANGEIVGISEAKVTVSNVEGMCYAIPVVSNLDTINQLITNNKIYDSSVVEDNGGFMGIQGQSVDEATSESYGMPIGVYIVSVVEGGGAEEAGIQKGDIITAIDGEEVTTITELSNKIKPHYPGDTVVITFSRADNGEYVSQDVTVTLTENLS